MQYLVKAGLDDIIPFIIAAIWVIAQIAGAAAKKMKTAPSAGKKPPDRLRPDERDVEPAREQPPQTENPLGDFLRQLVGGEELRAPEPQPMQDLPEKPLQLPPAASRPAGMKAEEMKARPAMVRPGIPEANILPIEQKASITKTIKEIEKVATEGRPKMSAFRSSVPSIKLPSMPSMSLRIDSPSYAEASRGKQGVGDELHLKDRNALRRAILSHIIFSPPKALEKSRAGIME